MPVTIDSAQLNDFSTMLKQAHGEFQAETTPRARKYRLYFVKRDKLKSVLTGIRNGVPAGQGAVPAGTKAAPVPEGIQAAAWKAFLDAIAAAEKLLREEEKKVKSDAPAPDPVKPPTTSGPTAAKRLSRRREARNKLKKLLKDIYGDKKGKLRYKVYEKMAKEAGREGSPQALWALFNGDTVEGQQELKEATRARRAGAAAAGTSSGGGAATDALAPVDAAEAAVAAGTQTGGIASVLWPADKPIYLRPATLIGGAVVLGVVGWLLLSPPKPKPAAKPVEKKPAEVKAP